MGFEYFCSFVLWILLWLFIFDLNVDYGVSVIVRWFGFGLFEIFGFFFLC